MKISCALWTACLVATGICGGCERRRVDVDAAATDALNDDALPNNDTLNVGLSVDFTISNCPLPAAVDADADAAISLGCCRATAPATLTFVPITAGSIDRQLWHFGDETSSTMVTPSHTYSIPQKYDVGLVVGGSAGSLSTTKLACVDLLANQTGSACDVDVQCEAPATCICGSQSQCSEPFLRGICSEGCRDEPCAKDAVCADLSLGGPATSKAPWRKPLCLAPCDNDTDCGLGMACRDLPGRFPSGKWFKACFPGFPLALGSPCKLPQGTLDSPSCVSGLCADVGALGQCTFACEAADCPNGTSCTQLATGEKLCLLTCTAADACNDDPWLSCQNAAASGTNPALGATNPAPMVCAPKPCTTDKDCTGGVCEHPDAGSGRCVGS